MNSYDNEITALFRVMDHVRKVWRNVTPCPELSKSQFGTLMAICHSKINHRDDNIITLSELANYMHQSNPALSQRIKALEELGYVERVSSNSDRRIIGIRLTDSGTKILEVAHHRFKTIMSEVIEKLGLEETHQLINSLTSLADAFEKALAEDAMKGVNNEEN